jgi:hypothetical protein
MLITNQTVQDYWFGPLHLLGGAGQTLTVDDTSATSLYLTDDGVADAINTLYASGKIAVSSYALPFPRSTGEPQFLHGDGSPEGLVYAGQGSLYIRRDSPTIYQKSTGVHLNTGWVTAVTTNPKVTTSLLSAGPPVSPGDGDEWVALAVDTGNLATTNGTIWRFRYNASSGSAYKWELIGGMPLSLYGLSGSSASTSGVNLANSTITIPRAGDYEFTVLGSLDDGNNWQNVTLALWDVTGSAIVGGIGLTEYSSNVAGIIVPGASQTRINSVSAGRQYCLRLYDSNNVSTVNTASAAIKATPYRIS